MKAMQSTVGSRDRLTVTLFLAGVFHLILILGISFAPPAADSGNVPTLEVLLVNNPLPDATRNDSANYLAERTQQGSGNSPDGRTRRPTAGDGPDTRQGTPDGGTAPPAPKGEAGGAGELLTGKAGAQPRCCRARRLPGTPSRSPAATRMTTCS
jgi:protein TonB